MKSGTSTTLKELIEGRIPEIGGHRGQTVFEARRSCYDDASSAVGRDKEKALVECTTRATLPRGVSGNWHRQADSHCGRRELMLLYLYSTSHLLVGDTLGQ